MELKDTIQCNELEGSHWTLQTDKMSIGMTGLHFKVQGIKAL